MKKIWGIWITAIVVGMLTDTSWGAIIHVPGEHLTIQAAIDAAANGDTVLVADETYTGTGNKNLTFGGKAITVRSESGDPNLCTIDCEGDGKGFNFNKSGEGEDSVVFGFTIANGSGGNGGCIYCENTSPTIKNNIIENNNATFGLGIYCIDNASPIIENNIIRNNTGANGGAGIYCENASPTIKNNIIRDNAANHGGGGILCRVNSSPSIEGNTISGNSADGGGGIHCVDSSPTIKNNIIRDNTAVSNGGGIMITGSSSPILDSNTIESNDAPYAAGVYCYQTSPTINNNSIKYNTTNHGGGIMCHGEASPLITNNTITDNTATDTAGGIGCTISSSPTITNNIISNNDANDGGGIICHDSSSPTIANNIITNNTAANNGGGIRCTFLSSPILTNNTIESNGAVNGGGIYCENASPVVTNSIIWGNSAADGPQIYEDVVGSMAITYSDIQDGWIGTGNIDDDPLFEDANGNDFHLTAASPCIDAGSNSAVGLPATDFDGEDRTVDGDDDGEARVDIGADEYLPPAGTPEPGATTQPTPTPRPRAEIVLNGTTFGPGDIFTATFVLHEPIHRAFTAFAVFILPDGSMRNIITLDSPPSPVVANVPGLELPFRYPLISAVVPKGAPKGNIGAVVAFFDSAGPITSRSDAFLDVSKGFYLE